MKNTHLSPHAISAIADRFPNEISQKPSFLHRRKFDRLQKIIDTHELSYGDRSHIERRMADAGTNEDHHKMLDSGAGYFAKQRMLLVHDQRRTKHHRLSTENFGETGKHLEPYDDSVTDRILKMHLHNPTDVDDCGVSARIRNDVHAFGSYKHREILQKHYPKGKEHGF